MKRKYLLYKNHQNKKKNNHQKKSVATIKLLWTHHIVKKRKSGFPQSWIQKKPVWEEKNHIDIPIENE